MDNMIKYFLVLLITGSIIASENDNNDPYLSNDILTSIQEISIRSTVIKTFEGSQLVIPNTDLTSQPVENWNY